MLSGGAEVSSAGRCGFWNCTLGFLHPGPGESWLPGRVAQGGGLACWWDGEDCGSNSGGLAVIRTTLSACPVYVGVGSLGWRIGIHIHLELSSALITWLVAPGRHLGP